MPASTVSAVLTRIGLGRLSRLERPEAPNRYERRRAGELLHIDVKRLVRIAGAGHRVTGSRRGQAQGIGWEFVHIAIDDATRIAEASEHVLPLEVEGRRPGSRASCDVLLQHFATYGIRIERVMSDNGPAYRSTIHALACWMTQNPATCRIQAPTDNRPFVDSVADARHLRTLAWRLWPTAAKSSGRDRDRWRRSSFSMAPGDTI